MFRRGATTHTLKICFMLGNSTLTDVPIHCFSKDDDANGSICFNGIIHRSFPVAGKCLLQSWDAGEFEALLLLAHFHL